MIYKTILFLIFCLMVINGFTVAQDRPRNSSIKGKISGKVIDKDLNTPLESAVIQVFRVRDSSLVTGTATNSKGEFSLDVTGGRFRLKASFIGYNTAIVSGIIVNFENKEINLETIKLESGSTTISEIDVTAERNYYEAGIDKKIYNIEKDLTSQSGTALDALKNIPSVSVDVDGNVSMRGSGNIRVLVNGRPSNFAGDLNSLLEQIPASSIQTIEIITNPSSKYDPEGTAGIINIVLKENQEIGYNLTLNSGTGTADKYNANATLGIRKGPWNFSINYGFRANRMGGYGNSFRTNNINDTISFYSQNSNSMNKMISHIGGLGIDYDINKKISIGLSSHYNYRTRNRFDKSDYGNFDVFMNPTNLYNRDNFNVETGDGYEVALNYKMKFNKPKEELTAQTSYSFRKEDENVNLFQTNFANGGIPIYPLYLENNYTNDKDYLGLIQVDYYNPIGEGGKFELGYKSNFRKTNTNYRADAFDNNQQIWVSIPNVANDFIYNAQTHAVYTNYGLKMGSFAFQAGLRAEQTLTTANQAIQNKSFDKNYFSIFPSIFLTQSLTKTQDIQVSYTRRINRPRPGAIDPFIDYSDPQNLRTGNPELNPEYISSFELGYLKYFGNFSVTSNLFYKLTNDVINRITTLLDSGVTLTTFKNLSTSNSYGLEFIASGQLLKWWFLNGNFSYFRSIVKGNYGEGDLDNSSYTWSARFNSTFSFPNLFDMQFAYNYNGKIVTAQGTTEPFQSFDFALKKDFFNKKFSVGFRVSDLFNSFKFSSTSTGLNFSQTGSRKRDSRNAFITLTFRFGTDDKSQRKKRNGKDENDNGNPEEDY